MTAALSILDAQGTSLSCPCCNVSGADFHVRYKLSKFDGQAHEVLQCRHCKLRFMHPMPDVQWLENYYRARGLYAAESDFAEDYQNAVNDKQVLFDEFFNRYLPKPCAGLLAVDFGAGSGYVVRAFQNMGLIGLGMELNPDAPRKARALFDVEVRNCGLEVLDEGSVTVFTMFEVLEHMTQPVEFLEQVGRKMTVDGLLIGTVPNYGGLGRILFGVNSSSLIQPEHVIYFDKPTLAATLRAAGFEPLFVGPRKPNQVIIGFGLRQMIYRFLGRNTFSRFLAFILGKVKKHLAYPLLNKFVDKTGKLAHGLTFVAKPLVERSMDKR